MPSKLKSLGRPAALVLGCLAFAALTVHALRSEQGPNPVTDIGAWTSWAAADPVNALVMLISALLAGVGAWGTVANLLSPNASRDDLRAASERTGEAVRDADAASAGRDASLVEHLSRLERRIEEMSASADPASRKAVADALAAVAASDDEGSRAARNALRTDDPRAVIRALMETQGEDRAASLKQAGALAAGFDISTAMAAYDEAMTLAPDRYTALMLGRLRWDMAEFALAITLFKQAAEMAMTDLLRAEAKIFGASVAALVDVDQAAALLVEARSLLESIPEGGEDKDVRQQLFRVQLLEGDLARGRQEYAEARRIYGEAQALLQNLLKMNPADDGLRREVTLVHERLALVAEAQGDRQRARAELEAALTTSLERLGGSPNDPQALWDASGFHHQLADTFMKDRDYETACVGYERAITIRERLHDRDPGNLEWLAGLITSLRRQGVCLLQLEQYAQGGVVAERMVALSDRLDRISPDASLDRRAARLLGDLGVKLSENADPAPSKRLLESAFDMRLRLAALAKDPADALIEAYDIGEQLVLQQRRMPDIPAALKAVRACRDICLERRAALPDDANWMLRTARLHGISGEVHQQAGAWRDAAESFAQAQIAYLAYSRAAPDQADMAIDMAAFCEREGRDARAKAG